MGVYNEDTLDQAEVFANSRYFQEGRYIVEIKACKYVVGHRGESFVIECIVRGVLSNHPNAPQPGELAAHVWSATGDKRDMAKGTWVGFLCSSYECKQEDYDGPKWKRISERTIDENYLARKLLHLECFMKTTQKGNPFTNHKWLGPPTPEVLAEFGL